MGGGSISYMRKLFFLIILIGIMLITGLLNPVMVRASSDEHFTDVNEKAWYYKDVMELTQRGLISGYSDKTFRPNASIRVDEFIKILVSAIDENIKPSQSDYWADSYINKAKELGIVKDGEFSDYTRYITRGEMARMIVRAGTSAKEKGLSLDIPENYKGYSYLISDYSALDSDSQDIALKAFASGIITGFSDGSFGFNKKGLKSFLCMGTGYTISGKNFSL